MESKTLEKLGNKNMQHFYLREKKKTTRVSSLFFKALVIYEAKPGNSGFIETGADVRL